MIGILLLKKMHKPFELEEGFEKLLADVDEFCRSEFKVCSERRLPLESVVLLCNKSSSKNLI